MATKEDVRQRVGEDLGLISIGQGLESQDQARIDKSFDEVYAILKERGLASWASTGEVPEKIMPYICVLIAQKLLISYSVPENRYLRITTDAGPNGSTALERIAELTIQEYESNDTETDF